MGTSLLGSFLGALVLRTPVGFALAAASLVTLWFLTDTPIDIGAQRIAAGITPFPLLAIPLFVLTGGLMNAGGITRRLLDLADAIVGRMRGGLAQTNVLSSLMFGGLSGSAVADVSSLGRVLIPAMTARGYRPGYAAATTAISALMSPILPPSITLILFGVVTGTSIGQLFFAGVVPAALFTLLLLGLVHVTVRRSGFTDEAVARAADPDEIGKTPRTERRAILPAFFKSLPALALPVLILVGIRGGYFTPTEAAAMSVVYALVVGFAVYRELDLPKLVQAMKEATQLIGLIMLVLAAAQLYSWALTSGRVPQELTSAITGLTENPLVLLLLINVVLLVIGMFIEANAALIIIVPILLPLALAAGIDPLHLGIIVVVNLGIGLITPPIGLTLLLSGEIAGISNVQAIRAALPFFAIAVLFLLLITYVPAISLWLPATVFGT
jgi:C4-dicarboxylate transporter, DctM subunit